jgi:NADH-quinone oxidoreductase subunit D
MKRECTIIPMGPFHPALAEPEFFKLSVKGEKIIDVEIRIGYNHRGIEKLAEGLTYNQCILLVERVCGICSNIHPLCFAQAVEEIAGVEVPDRAKYIRTIIAELERIHSHLLWLGLAGHIIGFDTLLMWAWKYRELVLDIFEAVTGNRQSYAMNAIGGVRRDLKKEHISKILKTMDEAERVTKRFIKAISGDPVTLSRLKGVGVLSNEDAKKYCVVGPVARASGLKIDIRKDYPYAAYDEMDFDIPVRRDGDALAKTEVRLEELLQSIRIIRQAVDALPNGDIKCEVKEMPEGEGLSRGEAPRGEDLHYVVSNGSNMPERVKIRAPTFMNLPSIKPQLIGNTIADALIIIGAIDPCFCCTDRLTIVDVKENREKIMSSDELLRHSRKKPSSDHRGS